MTLAGIMAATISSGNEGLDVVLGGGLPPGRLYLLEGRPGTGKTTLALRFLIAGLEAGESGLYITLSESKEELGSVALSHGFDVSRLDVFELSSFDDVFGEGSEQSILHPWEMELGETVRLIQMEVDRLRPRRVVFDSLSEMRLLAQDALRFRRQVLALKQFFTARDITVLLLDDRSADSGPSHLHSISHGVIGLERLTLDFGAARRRLQVHKLRGVDFMAGYHDFAIRRGGLDVFPRLIAADHGIEFSADLVPSGIAELDLLLAGGPPRGTSVLIVGPPGAGKTTIALQYMFAACERGEPCAVFQFDERLGTLMLRASAFGMDIQAYIDSGLLALQQIDPAEISPGEFAMIVRREVERGCRMIVIDSLNGYLAAMPQEQQLTLQMHELLSYLGQCGVTTMLVNPQQGLVGTMTSNIDISYVADAVILLRFFEADGRIRKAISVLKNRSGAHETAIREFRIDREGLRVGEPLDGFRGILSGTPEYVGNSKPLMEDRAGHA